MGFISRLRSTPSSPVFAEGGTEHNAKILDVIQFIDQNSFRDNFSQISQESLLVYVQGVNGLREYFQGAKKWSDIKTAVEKILDDIALACVTQRDLLKNPIRARKIASIQAVLNICLDQVDGKISTEEDESIPDLPDMADIALKKLATFTNLSNPGLRITTAVRRFLTYPAIKQVFTRISARGSAIDQIREFWTNLAESDSFLRDSDLSSFVESSTLERQTQDYCYTVFQKYFAEKNIKNEHVEVPSQAEHKFHLFQAAFQLEAFLHEMMNQDANQTRMNFQLQTGNNQLRLPVFIFDSPQVLHISVEKQHSSVKVPSAIALYEALSELNASQKITPETWRELKELSNSPNLEKRRGDPIISEVTKDTSSEKFAHLLFSYESQVDVGKLPTFGSKSYAHMAYAADQGTHQAKTGIIFSHRWTNGMPGFRLFDKIRGRAITSLRKHEELGTENDQIAPKSVDISEVRGESLVGLQSPKVDTNSLPERQFYKINTYTAEDYKALMEEWRLIQGKIREIAKDSKFKFTPQDLILLGYSLLRRRSIENLIGDVRGDATKLDVALQGFSPHWLILFDEVNSGRKSFDDIQKSLPVLKKELIEILNIYNQDRADASHGLSLSAVLRTATDFNSDLATDLGTAFNGPETYFVSKRVNAMVSQFVYGSERTDQNRLAQMLLGAGVKKEIIREILAYRKFLLTQEMTSLERYLGENVQKLFDLVSENFPEKSDQQNSELIEELVTLSKNKEGISDLLREFDPSQHTRIPEILSRILFFKTALSKSFFSKRMETYLSDKRFSDQPFSKSPLKEIICAGPDRIHVTTAQTQQFGYLDREKILNGQEDNIPGSQLRYEQGGAVSVSMGTDGQADGMEETPELNLYLLPHQISIDRLWPIYLRRCSADRRFSINEDSSEKDKQKAKDDLRNYFLALSNFDDHSKYKKDIAEVLKKMSQNITVNLAQDKKRELMKMIDESIEEYMQEEFSRMKNAMKFIKDVMLSDGEPDQLTYARKLASKPPMH